MSSKFPSGLVLITDRRQASVPLLDICTAAVKSGFSAIMLREKDLEADALYRLATPVAHLCRLAGVPLLINARLDVALAVGAGGHLGRREIPVRDARRILGAQAWLGYSAHDIDEARRAIDEGASYVTASPIHASVSKPGLVPRGLEFLAGMAAALDPYPVLALGGIDAGTLAPIRNTGARGAAVMGTMMRAQDPRTVARELVQRWEDASDGGF